VPAAFARSTRALAADRLRRPVWALSLTAVCIVAWLAWLLAARVTVYEVSQTARLEVDLAVHPVEAPFAARVTRSELRLGRTVHAGEILVELDAALDRQRLEEERRRLAALRPQLDALKRQVAAEGQAQRDERLTSRAALDEAQARKNESETGARFAEEEARRLERLKQGGGAPELDVLRAKAAAEQRRASAQAVTLDAQRIDSEARKNESQRRARLEELQRQIASIDGLLATTAAAVGVLEETVEKHLLRAPVDGELGDVATLRPGSVVREGDRLAAVVPSGGLRVIAEYTPASALGRVREGQPARVRLDGFPWTEYGSIRAEVQRVAAEARDGRLRVELAVPAQATPIPMQHGLPGTVEVAVEKVAPATLLLRAAGRLLAPPRQVPAT
jgi:membrane fusion protein (multidrug efflux system)